MLITLDVEASGLHEDSYPIQIGYTVDGEFSQTKEFLLKPAETWEHWDDEAEQFIHYISRDMINETGIDLIAACHMLNEDLNGQTVIVDSLDYDRFWLNKLYAEANMTMSFEIKNIDTYLTEEFSSTADDYEILRESFEFKHNAGEDSRVILQIIKAMAKANPV